MVTSSCADDNAQYVDFDDCKHHCVTSAALPLGEIADTDGNSVACRTYHAIVASSDPGNAEAIHCPHAGPSGANVCGSWCENYCHLALTNCTGDVGGDTVQ